VLLKLLNALMIEAVSTSETSVNFYQTTRRNIPENSHLHTRRRENLKSQLQSVYLKERERETKYQVGFEVLTAVSMKTVNFYQTTRCYNPEDSNLHQVSHPYKTAGKITGFVSELLGS
jgi:hypothetical protein